MQQFLNNGYKTTQSITWVSEKDNDYINGFPLYHFSFISLILWLFLQIPSFLSYFLFSFFLLSMMAAKRWPGPTWWSQKTRNQPSWNRSPYKQGVWMRRVSQGPHKEGGHLGVQLNEVKRAILREIKKKKVSKYDEDNGSKERYK